MSARFNDEEFVQLVIDALAEASEKKHDTIRALIASHLMRAGYPPEKHAELVKEAETMLLNTQELFSVQLVRFTLSALRSMGALS